MTLRAQLESIPPDRVVLVMTTLGHVYVGRLIDIEQDAITIERPDRASTTILSLGDVSGVREHVEEVGS